MGERKERCETCRFCATRALFETRAGGVRIYVDGADKCLSRMDAEEVGDQPMGECHRYPPHADGPDIGPDTSRHWPLVWVSSDWCGEWRAKPEAESCEV